MTYPSGSGLKIEPDHIEQLARIIRAIFPHETLSDAVYVRSSEAIAQAVELEPRATSVILEGLRSLDSLAGGLASVTTDDLTAVLRHIEQTEFFQVLLTSAVVTLYSDSETWEALGYEGPSYERGGYVDRGFNDLDWLPEPRIEENADQELVGYVPAIPGHAISFSTEKKVATI